MSLATDVGTLVERGIHYTQQYDTFSLGAKWAHDLVFGATRLPKDPTKVYTDFHVHVHKETNLRRMVAEAAKRVDVVAITGRTEDFSHNHHTLDTFLEEARRQEMSIDSLGENVLVAHVNGTPPQVNRTPLYIVRATEVYPEEMLGVVSVGGKLKREYKTHGEGKLDDAVKDAKDQCPFWFFDHPFSIPAPVISFRYPTSDEVKARIETFEKYDAAIEVGNHQNTLWMYLSNEIAKAVAEKHGLVGIANSDTHFRVREIGLSRTGFSRDLFDASTEAKFLASLRKAFSRENKDNLVVGTGYSSLWSFGNYMVVGGKSSAYQRLAVKYNL